jgi:hypothetical protein
MLEELGGPGDEAKCWGFGIKCIHNIIIILIPIDVDFEPLQSNVLVFLPESQTQPQCTSIFIIDDSILEDTEIFSIMLNATLNTARVNLGSPTLVSILDNDG